MNFDVWWKANKPEDIPVDCYHRVKEVCRAAWEKAQSEERIRCGLIADTHPFSPMIGGQIANRIYKETE